MPLGQSVAAHLPYLRRYARALTGSQASGDAFVAATLQAAVEDESVRETLKGGRVPLYRAFSVIWSHACLEHSSANDDALQGETSMAQKLNVVTPLSRQALLLTTLEDFTIQQTAEILQIEASTVEPLIQEAIDEIENERTTSVLIIEDEALISMQLENLVKGMGHEIFGTAATRDQAREVIAQHMPGLVLADIQLADGSSGIDAVDDLLAMASVPVIFITAYPERLLTGDRPEPTYLVTKPFQESTVRTAISQALFFASDRHRD